MEKRLCVDCPKCDGMIIEYASNNELVLFQHSVEQSTDCDGYMQIRVDELEQYGAVDMDDM